MLKKVLITLTILLALVGIGIGVYLVQQQQRLDKEAATEDGIVTIALRPGDQAVDIGEELTLEVVLDTKQIPIVGIGTVLEYNFQGQNPFEVVSYQYKLVDQWEGREFTTPYDTSQTPHKFSFALNYPSQGYSSSSLVVYEIKLRAVTEGQATLRFNPQDSEVFPSDNTAEIYRDILLTPRPEFYTYTVQAAAETPTATPTGQTTSPTVTPTGQASPTATPSTPASATATPTGQANPTATPTTPVAGGPEPTNTPTPTRTPTPTSGTSGATATPTSTQLSQANTVTPTGISETTTRTATPTPATELPVAANSTPTIILGVAGALILLIGFALLL